MGAQFQTVDKDDYLPSDHAMKDRLIQNLSVHNPCQVYAWGTNNNYTLGTGNQHSRSQPELLDFFRKNNISINQVWYGGLLLSKNITIFQNVVDTQFKSCSMIIIVIFLKKHFLHRVFYCSLLGKMFVLSFLSVIFYDLSNLNLLAAKFIYYGFNERSVKLLRSYLKEGVSHNKVLKLGMETFCSFYMRPRCTAGKYPEACVTFNVIRLIFAAVCVPWVDWEVFAYSEVFADSTEPICNSCDHHYFQ